MSVQTIHDVGSDHSISPKIDGGVYGTGIADCVCKGIGSEFAMTTSGLNVQFSAGSQAIIGGSFFFLTDVESVTNLPQNSTVCIVANINLQRGNGDTGRIMAKLPSALKSDNLNGNSDGERDLLLYTVTTSSSAVTNIIDNRVIRGDGTSINGYEFVVLSEAQYEALTPDASTIYFVFET